MKYIIKHEACDLILIFTMIISMLTVLSGCGNAPIEHNDEPQEQVSLVPADFADYTSIINMYRKIVEINLDYDDEKDMSGVYEAMFDIPGETEHNWYNDVFDTVLISMVYAHELENPEEAYGYALKDLNSNGEDDLTLLLNDYTVLAVFSLYDGKPVLLGTYLPRIRCAIDSEGLLFVRGSGGAAYTQNYIYRISQDGGELFLIEGFGIDGWDEENEANIYYKIVDGEMKRVDKEEIAGLWDIFRDDYIEETTKYSGIVFLPLFE